MKNKLFSLLFTLLASTSLWAQSGTCGPNLMWSLNNRVLTISGSGEMTDYLSIVYYAPWYQYRDSFNTVVIGDSVTSIGEYAFYDCSGLTSVTIPNSVTSIGERAFGWCSGLTSVTIPNSVTTIDEYAFNGCSGLTSVTIPNSVTYLHKYAFYGCSGLTSITIPNSVTSIGERAFYGCSGLTSVTIPNSVTSIGKYAFGWCSGLTSVTIPNSVTSIGDYAFSGCNHLTSITIPNSVWYIGDNAFSDCGNLTTVVFNASRYHYPSETLQRGSFFGCDKVKNFTFGDSIRYISEYTYFCAGMTHLTSVTIPNSVISIGDSAFSGCNHLTSITIPDSVKYIGWYAFENCSRLTSVVIGTSVTSIGPYAFKDCSSMTSITIPESMTYISNCAFLYCYNLSTVTMMPSTPPTLGMSAFLYNDSNRVFMLNGCSYDDYYASKSWSNYRNALRDPTINISFNVLPNNPQYGTADIEQLRGHDVRCDSTAVIYATANENYHFGYWSNGSTENPCTIHLTGDSIVTAYFLIDISYDFSAVAPTGQTLYYRITDAASHVVSVVAPHKLNSNHYSWTDYTLPKGILTIPDSVMYNDTIYRVMSIGVEAFKDCSELTSVTIPEAVTSIGDYAFENCSGLTTITMMPATPPTLGVNSFSRNDSNRVFIMNGCSYDNYYTTSTSNRWYEYRNALRDPTINFSINVLSNNPQYGTVGIRQIRNHDVRCDSTAVIYATVNDGYHFNHWSNGSTANPDTIMLTSDSTITAYFIGLTVASTDESRGSVSHAKIGDCIERISAMANDGYHFDHWSNGSTANPDTIMLTSDSTITAYFIGLTVASTDESRGSVSHAKFGDCLERISATANDGYHFGHWSNGSTANPDTIMLTSDSTITAYFIGLTIASNDESRGSVSHAKIGDCLERISATANDGYHFGHWSNGSTANPDTIMLTSDSTITAYFIGLTVASTDESRGSVSHAKIGDCIERISAMANDGYHFDHWSNGSTANPDTIMLTSDSTITVYFLIDISYDFSAVAPTGQTLYYRITDAASHVVSVVAPHKLKSNHYSWTDFTAPTGVLSIPESVMYNDTIYKITSIGVEAFMDCSGLTSITIPEAVTSIGNYAFKNCTGLTSVVFNATNCTSAGSGYSRAFYGCTNVSSITFGDSVRNIPAELCYEMLQLTSITIPEAVTSIGDYAFYGCSSLSFVNMMPRIRPYLGVYSFTGNASNRVFILNGCSYDNYYTTSTSSRWYEYRNDLRDPTINISINVLSNNPQYGTVGIRQIRNHDVRCDSTAVIYATAKEHHYFDHWSNGSTDNPCTIHLIGDSTVTAYFERNSYSVSVSVNDASLGTITYPYGNNALYGDTLAIVAQPVDHHHVVNWSGRDIVLTSAEKDTVWLRMTANRQLLCTIAIDTLTVEVDYDFIKGNVTGAGEYVYGTPCTLLAFAYTGYTFNGWSNGITANPYIFAVIENTKLTALFETISGIDEVTSTDVKPKKVWSDGQLYILLPDGKKYTTTGQLVK